MQLLATSHVVPFDSPGSPPPLILPPQALKGRILIISINNENSRNHSRHLWRASFPKALSSALATFL